MNERKIRVEAILTDVYTSPMTNETFSQQALDYQRIEQAIRYLEANFQQQPNLAEIAGIVHLSPHHFQRLFKRWAGISPTQFLHYLTINYAKQRLAEANNILETALDAGLSSPSRLHDLFVSFEAMSPGEYKQQGANLIVRYGFHDTPFGQCLLATTERGICAIRFVGEADNEALLVELQNEWALATLVADPAVTEPLVGQLFTRKKNDRPFHLLVRGTNFQVQVWQALLRIPPGSLVSYGQLAGAMGKPTATRAVATAIAKNPIGYLIPCHRVISNAGILHNYRWGSARKKAMVAWEGSHTHLQPLV
jgi:AraC family transcriptional regulator of adaptative response/methylated-DNA-[protein]-cysteine methyltransferase